MPDTLRRRISRLLMPWYRPEHEALRDVRSRVVAKRADRATVQAEEAERLRASYRSYAGRLDR